MLLSIVILEGFKRSNQPKIEILRGPSPKPLFTSKDKLIALVTDKLILSLFRLPQFKHNETKKLTDWLERKIL